MRVRFLRPHGITSDQEKARQMTAHLELLRTIVTHTVHEPPPGKLLVGKEVDRWARTFAFSRPKLSGERIGVRRDGVAAAIKLADLWQVIALTTIAVRVTGPSLKRF
jgi:hypothetical protein